MQKLHGFFLLSVLQDAVDQVANLTLVSSACDMVSTVYASTKDIHPCIRSVCDAAERGVRSVTAATASCVQPVLTSLEPRGNPPSTGSSAPASEGFSGSLQKGVLGCGNAPLSPH